MKKKCMARLRKEALDQLVSDYKAEKIDLNALDKLGRLIEVEARDAKTAVSFSVKFGITDFCKEQFID